MIPTQYLTEWAASYPWKLSEQVEQDLLISRAVVAIYSDPYLAERLAWRGGTALYKLYLKPQPRYREDIDLVLIHPEPMGPILDRLREVLSFIPDMQAKGKRYKATLKNNFYTYIVSQRGCVLKRYAAAGVKQERPRQEAGAGYEVLRNKNHLLKNFKSRNV